MTTFEKVKKIVSEKLGVPEAKVEEKSSLLNSLWKLKKNSVLKSQMKMHRNWILLIKQLLISKHTKNNLGVNAPDYINPSQCFLRLTDFFLYVCP